MTQTEHLPHGNENEVFLGADYVGAAKREERKDRGINWQIAMKRSKLKAVPEGTLVGRLISASLESRR